MRFLLLLAAFFLLIPVASAQVADLPFSIEIVERDLPDVPALHSFAAGHYEDLWLLVTGRTDGLHGFGENPFPNEFATTKIWVVDPATGDSWSASLDEFPDDVRESLRVTNSQHDQIGDFLIITGGYGHSAAAETMITFPRLTVINIPGMIDAVRNGTALAPHLLQLEDERFAVTGGELRVLGDYLYQIAGNRFDGEYSGPGSVFEQEYMHRISRFAFEIENDEIIITEFEIVAEAGDQMRRRDLTVGPVVWGGDREGFALYSGVFRPDIDWPWRNPIYFFDDDVRTFEIDESFEQTIGHYTAPMIAVLDTMGTMHSTIFGGTSLYFVNDSGNFQMDPLVPFIRDVATISRAADGTTIETLQDFAMPGLLGTNMAYIPIGGLPRFNNGVIRLEDLTGRTFVGYLYGGIEATGPHPGMLPHTGTSHAANRVFEVFVTPRTTSNEPGITTIAEIEGPFPNPFGGNATVALVIDQTENVRIELFDMLGRRVAILHNGPLSANQRHAFTIEAANLPSGAYFVRIAGESFVETRTVIRVN